MPVLTLLLTLLLFVWLLGPWGLLIGLIPSCFVANLTWYYVQRARGLL